MVDPQVVAQANDLLARGAATEAFAFLSAKARSRADDGEIAFLAGQAGLAAGDSRGALELLETAFRAAPNAVTHYFLAVAQTNLGLTDYALRNLTRAIKLEPRYWQAHYQLGLVHDARAEWADAEKAYRNAATLNADFADAQNNLANAMRRMGRTSEARAVLQQVLSKHPRHVQALFNLAQIEADSQRYAEATSLLERAHQANPTDNKTLKLLAKTSHLGGQTARAAEVYRLIAKLDPADEAASFVGDFLAGINRPQPPEDFVVQLMDDLAPRFDHHLVEKLEYRAPELIGRMLTTSSAPASLRILDLGCGTGLVGQSVRSVASRIVGVDLAPGMLEVARSKRLYDELVQDDMQRYLERCGPAEFDTIIAADAFVYVGDLCGVFDEVSRVLASGPGFIFSIEVAPNPDDEYLLQSTGRYCHSQRYIERLAAERGLKVASIEAVPLRLERDRPVQGAIIQLTKLG